MANSKSKKHGIEVLGVDISDRPQEMQAIIEDLGIRNLSNESLTRLCNVDKSLRESWVNNHANIDAFTDDSVKVICDSLDVAKADDKMNKSKSRTKTNNGMNQTMSNKSKSLYVSADKYHEAKAGNSSSSRYISAEESAAESAKKSSSGTKIFSDHYDLIFTGGFKNQLDRIIKQGYEQAKNSSDNMTANANFYNYVNYSIESAFPNFSKKTVDYVSEMAVLGSYDKEKSKYLDFVDYVQMENGNRTTSFGDYVPDKDNKPKNGGRIIFHQMPYDDFDAGSFIQSKIKDIDCMVGDHLGLEDDNKQHIFAMPSTRKIATDHKSFSVVYSEEIPYTTCSLITKLVKDELASSGHGFDHCDVYYATPYEVNQTREFYSANKDEYHISKEMLAELDHAKEVSDGGYDEDGYNADGYDATGHSRNGDYSAIYDQSFQDDGDDGRDDGNRGYDNQDGGPSF